MPRARKYHPDALHFGALVRVLRIKRGWTVTDLARRSGMNRNYLGVLESGGNIPSLVTILDLADVLGVDPTMFVEHVASARAEAVEEKRAKLERPKDG